MNYMHCTRQITFADAHLGTVAVPVGVISLFHRDSASGSDLTVLQRQCQWE